MTVEIKFTYTFPNNSNTGVTYTNTDAIIDYTKSYNFDYVSNGKTYVATHYDGTGTVDAIVNGKNTVLTLYGVNYTPSNPLNDRYQIVAQTSDMSSGYVLNFGSDSKVPTNIYFEDAAYFSQFGQAPTYQDDEHDQVIADSTGTVCFCTGTLIRTVRGEVAVEDLAVGDLAITASGEHRPIRWIGHTEVDCRNHPRPREAMPVRVQANAFGPNRPERDLWLSPGHAVCLDVLGEVFVPVSSLINGATVAQVDVDTITYWHVELDSHDVLIANGMPAESYMDVGNRSFFGTGKGAIDPDRTAMPGTGDYCRPFHQHGALVEAVRGQVKARALSLGWTIDEAPPSDLHLIVDGVRVDPEGDGLLLRFIVPATAREVVLMSKVGVPRDLGSDVYGDDRRLGVCFRSLTIDDGLGTRREVAHDDARLTDGFYGAEPDHRWTDGQARLPASLWEGCRGSFFLRVDLTKGAEPRWVAPESLELSSAPVIEPVQTGLRLVHAA